MLFLASCEDKKYADLRLKGLLPLKTSRLIEILAIRGNFSLEANAMNITKNIN
jgi:hypothetical protein